MTDTTASATPTPDRDTMLSFLGHAFGGDLDGLHYGLIEIAHTDPYGALRHAKLFGTDELEEAAAHAATINSTPGVNVYYGAALRRPDAGRDRRASKLDVHGATIAWADWDAPGALDAAREKYQFCKPTLGIVTGRHPHKRGQAVWRLETPLRGVAEIESALAGIQSALNSDPTVVDAARVMRLPGGIAWPVKEGRVVEPTSMEIMSPRPYPTAQVLNAFQPVAKPAPEHTSGIGSLDTPGPGVNVHDLMARIRTGDQWHNNMLRLVAHWVARGWSDEEIKIASVFFTTPPWSHDDTLREVETMIRGARAKWNKSDPGPADTEDYWQPGGTAALTLNFGRPEDLDAAAIEPRPWLYGDILLRRYVSLLVAPPGIGKSTLTVEIAVNLALGRSWAGWDYRDKGAPPMVWMYNNEDDTTEMRRRLRAAALQLGLDTRQVATRVHVNSGADRPVLIARQDRDGNTTLLPDREALIAEIKRYGIGLLIIDPFAETFAAPENSNDAMKIVAAAYREIAQKANCAILLVHHTRKASGAAADSHVGNMDTVRGAGAIVGVVRVVNTLFTMTQRDAEGLGIDGKEAHKYIRLDGAKANLSLVTGEAKWFQKVGVDIGNGEGPGGSGGDMVGTLVPWEPPPPPKFGGAQAYLVLDAAREAWRIGQPYTTGMKSPRWLGKLLLQRLPGMRKDIADEYIHDWLTNGVIEEVIYDNRNKKTGVKVHRMVGEPPRGKSAENHPEE